MVFFMLLAFLCFARFRKSGNKSALTGFFIFWIAALQSSPDAIILPVLLAGYDVLILKQSLFSEENRKRLWLYAAMACLAVLYLFSQFVFYSGLRFVDGLTSGHFQWRKRIIGVLWALVHLFIPRREILSPWISPTSFHRILIPVVALAPFPWLFFRSRRKLIEDQGFLPVALFSLFWFLIAFLPFAALTRTAPWKEFPPARYFYIPMIGLSFFVGKSAEILLNTVSRFRPGWIRTLFFSWMAMAGIYFYALNVSTFCFMADRLDQNWRLAGVTDVQNTENS